MITPLRYRLRSTTNAATAINVDLPQIKPGQFARISHAAVENESGEAVTLLLGIESQGQFDQIYAKQTVANADAFGVMLNLLLLEADKFRARITGAANSSTVTFIVSGELHDSSPEIVEVVTKS